MPRPQNKGSRQELLHASDLFYTRIPHVFGMSVPPVINNEAMLKEKLALIEVGILAIESRRHSR